MTTDEAKALLEQFRAGDRTAEEVLYQFRHHLSVDLDFATLDAHRAFRKQFPEVVFGAGKTVDQMVRIVSTLFKEHGRVLATRVESDQAAAIKAQFSEAGYHETARCLTLTRDAVTQRSGRIAVVCAGTSDVPVAEEAVITAETMGNPVDRVYDVGVAGLHRLLNRMEVIHAANVVVVVAGMEGALPSVVAGLVAQPVIAVPTSVGYGASFDGLAALLGMLNSCGSGVTVVNIDNGFGAAYAASQINALACNEPDRETSSGKGAG